MLCQIYKNKTCEKNGVPCDRLEKHLDRFEVAENDDEEPTEEFGIDSVGWHFDRQAEDFTPESVLSNYYNKHPHTLAEVASYMTEPRFHFDFLSKDENKVFAYCFFKGMKLAKISQIMKRSESAMKSLKAGAKGKIRNHFLELIEKEFF